MKYGELTLGQVAAIVNKIGGMEGVQRLLAGELVVKPASEKVFPIWKTVKLGTGLKAADDFRRALRDGGFKINDWASDILGKPAFTAAGETTEKDLVRVTVAELGFKKGARQDQIYERAKEFGLELCPAEVGPQLRLQYPDQPEGEWILVAMEAILDSDGGQWVFDVECDASGLWLGGLRGAPDRFRGADSQWVFCRPRSPR